MTASTAPWRVASVNEATIADLAARHVPDAAAVELRVEVYADPHREDDDGNVWALLRRTRDVRDVTPGSVVVVGSHAGRWLARVLAWDFEVDPHDPIVTLDLLPFAPEAVGRALRRNAIPAA